MLTLTDLSLQRGGNVLFDGATATIFPGHRVGVTGANGSGKSSLFELLLGRLQPDRGEVSMPPGWIVAHVAQETPAVATAALDYVRDGDAELRRLERAIRRHETDATLTAADSARHGVALAELHARFEAVDGYRAPARAARLLAGLGFSDSDQQRPVAEFSGGWRMRLNLAQALMCRSDLLLLDEPTNHLDLDTVLWLEQWLRDYAGTLLLISHDRDFLDGVAGHILHLEQRRFALYNGNYTAFEQQRAARLAGQQAAYQKQQREIAHLTRFVDRFRAKASKARQAQSRLKALEKLERIAAVRQHGDFGFAFRQPPALPSPLLGLRAVTAGYDDAPVLRGVRLNLQPGQRIGLLGRNGAGKSTLIKLLAGMLTPREGERTPAQDLAIGYFAQHQLEQLRGERTPLQHLQRLDAAAGAPVGDQVLRDFLGGFGFGGDMAARPVGPMSGGERARLVLALMVWQRPNLLLLDEPTNHLDLQMRDALTIALQEFSGALVVVSHDRHLLRTVSDELWLVDAGAVRPFDGDLDDYRAWLAQRDRQPAPAPAGHGAGDAVSRRDRRRQEAAQRQRLQGLQKPLKHELSTIEKRLSALNETRGGLETELAGTTLYQEQHKARLQQVLIEKGELDRELAELEERWFRLQEELEALTAGVTSADAGGAAGRG